jgi:hypothetical protein
MPFDVIVVRLRLLDLYERGVRIGIDYYKQQADGGLLKLATGSHCAVWQARTPQGSYAPAPLPAVLSAALLEPEAAGA